MLACLAVLQSLDKAVAAPGEASLRAADAEQMRIIVEGDAQAQQEFMHENYIINGPLNKVRRKSQVVAMLSAAQMARESFERTIEGLAITGNVGITTGREIVKPSAGSRQALAYGEKPLERRFANVFLFENGKWRFLARQATVVTDVPASP